MANAPVRYNVFRGKDFSDSIRAAFAHQEGLQSTISELCEAAKGFESLNVLLHKLQVDARGLSAFLSSFIGTDFYNERCPTHARNVAQKVFDILEILELILLNAGRVNILNVMRVNRQFQSAIQGSILLQRELLLIPEPGMHFHCTEIEDLISGVSVDTAVEYWRHDLYDDEQENISGLAADEDGIMVRLSSITMHPIPQAYRNMYFCQTPVKEMESMTDCCRDTDAFMPAHALSTVKRDSGVTIGDLYNEAERLFKKHQHCPNSTWMCQDSHGNARVLVQFAAIVKLKADDPILAPRREMAMILRRRRKAKEARDIRMEAFWDAKQLGMLFRRINLECMLTVCTAKANGAEIPTLKEFEEAHPEYSHQTAAGSDVCED